MGKNILFVTICAAFIACTSKEMKKPESEADVDNVVLKSDTGEMAQSPYNTMSLEQLFDAYMNEADSLRILLSHEELPAEERANAEQRNKELEKDFENALAAKPEYAKVVQQRNILKNFFDEMYAAEERFDPSDDIKKQYPEAYKNGNDVFYHHLFYVDFLHQWYGKMIKMIGANPSLMEYPEYMFREFVHGMSVMTSDDGRIRYYNWDASSSGSLYNAGCFCQYRTDDGKVRVSFHQDENDKDNGWQFQYDVKKIHTLNLKGKRAYLLQIEYSSDESHVTRGFHVEAIEKDGITHPEVFVAEDGSNAYLVNDYFSFDDPKEWYAKYDGRTRTIYLRDSNENDHYKAMNTYTTYTFDGNVFKPSKKK